MNQKSEIHYSVLGNESLVNRATRNRKMTRTHSCFTWAREMLDVFDGYRIEELLEPQLGSLIAEVPSAYITSKGNSAVTKKTSNISKISTHVLS